MTNNWQGEFATKKLGLSIAGNDVNLLNLEDLVGVALRKNPKRAHLLVSKVLGKHYPQSPRIIQSAAHILAEQVSNFMLYELENEGVSFNQGSLTDLASALAGDRQAAVNLSEDLNNLLLLPFNKTAVFGFAETATALGASIADRIEADYYINSTRYPDIGAEPYGFFEEEHSHASSHHLTPKDSSVLSDPETIMVLVDDELTTGNTLMNTIEMLQKTAQHSVYLIATLVDLRNDEARVKMAEFASRNNVTVEVFSLFSGHLEIPVDAAKKAEPIIEEIKKAVEPVGSSRSGTIFFRHYLDSPEPTKNGVTSFDDVTTKAQLVATQLATLVVGKTLVLGIEEEMYFPLRVAQILEDSHGKDISFSTTTRSPVVAYNNEGYAIQDRIKYEVPPVEGDTSDRFSYNIGFNRFDSIVILTNGAEETRKLTSPEVNLLGELKKRTRNIFVLEASMNSDKLQEPLTAPEFGSYRKEDVEWLLKDLSNVALEGATEDREEAIQSGGAHYAESLPIEYQPTADYQTLFLDSLEESKSEMALSIAVVAEQIYRQRNAHPVLVSLARAGTPIGVLIKRYLTAAYGIDAPHYAISIVRGKGIDYNALNYIAKHHDPQNVVFVDGWTGKGAIVNELTAALDKYKQETGITMPSEVAVLADPAHSVTLYGTRDDFLIPSACLNSTVSGLVSRTVLNKHYIGENDYHGAKFYAEFADNDFSNLFVDTVSSLFVDALIVEAQTAVDNHVVVAPDWAGWKAIERISEEYGINDVNLVKPGVGETTRVLLRRVPWKVLVRPDKFEELLHVRLLAENRGVPVELVENLPYAAIGLIHPKYTKGATGFDGKASA